MASGNLSATSWWAEAASPVILTFLKPNLFLKLSNHPMLAFNAPALDPSPSFCFWLSYNDSACSRNHIRVYSCDFLMAIWTHIKVAFSVWDQKVFHKKCKVFASAGVSVVMASQISSSFFSGSYTGFIYLEMVATTATDLHLQHTSSNSTFSCHVMTFLCFLGALPASLVALGGSHGVI